MCSFCRMAISEKRWAAEVVDREGAVFKFDDIGCMVRYLTERSSRERAAAIFVMDYPAGRWLDAAAGLYVQSGEIPSPMSGGLAAFADRSQAAQLAAQRHGRILGFEDLWRK